MICIGFAQQAIPVSHFYRAHRLADHLRNRYGASAYEEISLELREKNRLENLLENPHTKINSDVKHFRTDAG